MYRIVIEPIAEEQIAALPDEATGPLAELFTLLETAPWSGDPYNLDRPKGNMLTYAFGERGLATYVVMDDQRETLIVRIEWP